MTKPIVTLENLTPEQVEMLDMLWSLKDENDFEDWYNNLNDQETIMCETLMTLVVLEAWDNEIVQDLSLARNLLKRFM